MHMTHEPRFLIEFHDTGRLPQNPPDPRYPDGVDLDVSQGAAATCTVPLPSPAPFGHVGLWLLCCEICGYKAAISAAGRPDDPRSVTLPCLNAPRRKPLAKPFRYPPQACPGCGETLNAASTIDGANTEPADLDLSLCAKCGQALQWIAGHWAALTTDDIVNLDPEARRELFRGQQKLADYHRAKAGGDAV